jgi:hypothetical protein
MRAVPQATAVTKSTPAIMVRRRTVFMGVFLALGVVSHNRGGPAARPSRSP